MEQNNNKNIEHMKNVLDLFYKHNKEQKERPKITVKLQSTVTPSEKLTFEDWCKEYRVSLTYDKKIVHIG
jgi:hypothetical protein